MPPVRDALTLTVGAGASVHGQGLNSMNDHSEGPVWARPKRSSRSAGNPLVAFLVTLLALFGALTAVLGVKERSVADGGAIIDGWITSGWTKVRSLGGKADDAAVDAAESTGRAMRTTGDAVEKGADRAVDDLKK